MIDQKIMPRHYSTAASLTQGHPDKLCDQIADAMVDAVLGMDPGSIIDCQVVATKGLILVSGEAETKAYVNVADLVRQVIRDVGFEYTKLGFDADTCGVLTSMEFLGRDICTGYYKPPSEMSESVWNMVADLIVATEQVTVIGFACDETPELIPMPTVLAHRLCRQLDLARKEGLIPLLRPDGVSQVTVEYEYGWPKRVASVAITTQHGRVEHLEMLEVELLEKVVRLAIPGQLLDGDTQYLINPAGRSYMEGPFRAPGASGRQSIVDGYGSSVGACGPSFVGKDPMRISRCAAYMARHVAKNVVAAGLADRFRVEITYVPGVARPVAVTVDAFGTEKVPLARIQRLILREFDLRPAPIVEHLRLKRPVYRATATYGAFGRTDIDAPWEETDHAERLRSEARLKLPQELFGLVSAELHGPLGMKPGPQAPAGLLPGHGGYEQQLTRDVAARAPASQEPAAEAPTATGGGMEAKLSAEKLLASTDLRNAHLVGADLRGACLRGFSLARANLSDADLTGADLSGCDLAMADFSRANLSSARLISADLTQARLENAKLMNADLTGATLVRCNLQEADLSGATLRNADLRKGFLLGTCLRSADLSGADLTEATLSEVDLADAAVEIDQIRSTIPPAWAIRCPVCLKNGIITEVSEEGDPEVDFFLSGNLPELWPCGHFAEQAWEFFWPNYEAPGNDWLRGIGLQMAEDLDELLTKHADDLAPEAPCSIFTCDAHHGIEECFYSHFDIVKVDTGDRWGSEWILPFIDGDEKDALRRGWQDVESLFDQLQNPFEPETKGWKVLERARRHLIKVCRTSARANEPNIPD